MTTTDGLPGIKSKPAIDGRRDRRNALRHPRPAGLPGKNPKKKKAKPKPPPPAEKE